jgi:kexin
MQLQLPWTLLLVLFVQQPVLASIPTKRSYLTHNYYVLEHNPLAVAGASLISVAKALGVEVVEQAGELQNHWLVRTEIPSEDSDLVIDAFQRLQATASLERETHLSLRSAAGSHAHAVVSSLKYLSRQYLRQRIKRAPPPPHNESLAQRVASRLGILDPRFPEQWHLVNDDYPEHMMNVTPVWDMGFTGKGVISSLVDDGLDYTSVDLMENFVRALTKLSLNHSHQVFRTQTTPTILMTTRVCQHLKNLTITMGRVVRGRSLLGRILLVA